MERMNSNDSVSSTSNSAFRRFTFRAKKEKHRDELEGQGPRNITHISIPDQRSPHEVEALSARPASPGSTDPSVFSLGVGEDPLHQLHKTITKLRSSLKKSVDDAFQVYADHAHMSAELCKVVLQKPQSDGRNGSFVEGLSDISLFRTSSSSSSKDVDARSRLVHEYVAYLEALLKNIRTSLSKVYQTYEPHAQNSQIEALFNNRAFRNGAIQRMRNTSMNKLMSDPPLVWDQYKIRFRNYEKLEKDIANIKELFQMPSAEETSAASIDIRIAENGDTILRFNSDGPAYPILRFRVSSHMLYEASPLFAQMLSDSTPINRTDYFPASAVYAHEMLQDLPPPPTTQILRDGSSVKVYLMPQIELNKHNSLTTLLESAHMHRDKVPREISFPEFVSIAEVCLKYRCTSPIEDSVELRWLPKWVVKAADEVPDAGLLLICYVFGLRRLFCRMSKSAILNMRDEKDLANNLPEKVRDSIITIRNAKLKQIQSCCLAAISEYLGTQLHDPVRHPSAGGSLPFSSVPRCPKGDHSCDAQNLGWLMLVFKEVGVLPSIMKSDSSEELPRGSLKDLMNKLRLVRSAPAKNGHGEVCDFAPPFRNAIDDVYNSIAGLTLRDVTGLKGWSLSRLSTMTPADTSSRLSDNDLQVGGRGLIQKARNPKKHNLIMDPEITLRVLSYLDNFNDLRSAAMIKKSFYAVYKSNKLSLMTGLLLKAERRATISRNSEDILTLRQSLQEGVADISSATRQLHMSSSDSQPESNETPTLEHIEDTQSSSSPLHSYFQTTPNISEEEMERILYPSTPPMSGLLFRGSESRFSISTSSSHSDLMSSPTDDCEIRNEKYRLESKDDLKHTRQVENKYLREEGDRRLGIGF